MSADKQLATVDPQEVQARIAADQGLSLKQFAVAAGVCYEKARDFSRKPGFPMIDGFIFYSDFVLWRRKQAGLAQLQPTASRPSSATAGKHGVRRS